MTFKGKETSIAAYYTTHSNPNKKPFYLRG